jgi:hypothetical protein
VLPSTATPADPNSSGGSWLGFLWGGSSSGAAFDSAELTVDGGLTRGERVVQLAAGTHHLLALTSTGRTLAHPLDARANVHGQLGVRAVSLPAPGASGRAAIELAPAPGRIRGIRAPAPTWGELAAQAERSRGGAAPAEPVPSAPAQLSEAERRDIRWCDRLFEVPALRGIPVAQVAAGGRSSLARTEDGRVLAWGGNEYGWVRAR